MSCCFGNDAKYGFPFATNVKIKSFKKNKSDSLCNDINFVE